MATDTALPGLAARWLVLGEWRAHPARVVVAALAIAVGVALGFAVHLVNASALASFDRAVQTVNGAAELQVHSTTPAGFAERLYPQLARLPGITAASPVVELAATSGPIGAPGTAGASANRLTLLGLDIFRAARVTPGLVGVPLRGGPGRADAFGPDSLFVSRAALTATGKRIGDRVSLTAAGRRTAFHIAGLLPGAGDERAVAVIDIAEAQWRFGQLGRLQRIDLAFADGADRAAIRARLAAILPADAELASPASTAARSDALSRAYRVNLEMLAMVALLTGGFLVYSAQALSVARRGPHFALLRVLGLRQRGVAAQVVVEGAVLGTLGAGIGIGLGYGLARLALARLGGDLGSGVFGSGTSQLVFPALPALAFAALGLAVAVAGSLVPALAAARDQPAVALKRIGSGDPRRAPPLLPGLLLLGAGGLAALAPPLAGLPLLGYAAMALMLAGGVAAMPWLARALLAPLQGVTMLPPLDLAAKRLWGAPGAAAVALCGIVASTALTIAMAVMVASFRTSVDAWLVQLLPADIYLHVEAAEGGGLDPAAQARLAAVAGVRHTRFVRALPLRLAADQPPVTISAQPIDPDDPGAHLPMIGAALAVPAGAVPVWVSEPMTWIYGAKPGDTLRLPLGGTARTVMIAGVWRDYARQFGAIAIRDRDFVRLTGDASKSEAAIDVAPGADVARVIAGLRATLPPGLADQTLFGEPRVMRAMALTIFDRSFAITYGLEAIALVIGLIGVATTFSAQTLARSREFGMLRHLGVRRGEIIAMLAAEGALLGALGGVAGIALGLAMSQVLIHVVNPQSFHWTMETSVPWRLIIGLEAALVAAAAGTAVLAGQRALSADAVRAVRDDW